LWGLVAVVAVFALVRRMTGGVVLPALGALCFIAMPVTLNLAHEAKPHLAGGALLRAAVLAAANYVQGGKAKWMLLASVCCGLAVGMVLSAVVGLILIPTMAALRKQGAGVFIRDCILGVLIAAVVYFAANPYVAMHLANADQRQVLRSNLGNSSAMYTI